MNPRENLIYIPTYNDSKNIYNLLKNLDGINFNFDILIVDDCSVDSNLELILKFINDKKNKYNISLLKCKRNYGLATSQKIAIEFFLKKTKSDNLIILHGDGQYDAKLVNLFEPYLQKNFGIVQGMRNKKKFGKGDQTPLFAYFIIKILNIYENIICRAKFKEWHSGFVFYKRRFLSQIPLENLTDTPHIDGNILYIAKLLSESVASVDIYKLYKKEHRYNKKYIIKYFFTVIYLPFYFILRNKKLLKFKKRRIKYEVERIF